MFKLRTIGQFARLNRHQKCLIGEAQALIILARLALACLPFRVVAHWLNHPVDRRQMMPAQRELHIREVRWAIAVCARAGLCKAVCFPQGIAAKMMLMRRGLVPTLYYGVRKQGRDGLQAHVWVKERELPVIGAALAETYTFLYAFSDVPGDKENTLD